MRTPLYYIFWIACSAIFVRGLYVQFGQRPVRQRSRDITAFFYIDEILKRDEKRFLSVICLLPLATLGTALLYHSDTVLKFIVDYILASFGIDSGESAGDSGKLERAAETPNIDATDEQETKREPPSLSKTIYDKLPNFMLPISVLLFGWLFIGARITAMQARIENRIVYLLRIRQQVHGFVTGVAELLLRKKTYAEVQALLNVVTTGQIRLPRELVGSTAAHKLAFQLLELTKSTIPKYGTTDAIFFRTSLYFPSAGLPEARVAFPEANVISVVRRPIYRILWIYVVVCGFYASLVPLLAFAPTARDLLELLKAVWPEYQHLRIQLREIGVRGIAGVLPTVAALLYIEYRWHSILVMKYAVVFTASIIVLVWSVVVNSIDMGIYLAQIATATGEYEILYVPGIVFDRRPELYHVLTYSSVPAVCTFLVGIVVRNGHLHTWGALLGALIFGLGFFLAQWTFETTANWEGINYFWHQGLMGFVLGCGGLLAVSTGKQLRV